MENTDKLIEKWEKLGLLDNSKNKKRTAMALELATLYMLTNVDSKNAVFIIPVVANIFSEIEEDISMAEIIDKVDKIYNEMFIPLLVNIEKNDQWIGGDKNSKIEIEDKFIVEFCHKYKNKHIKTYKVKVYTPEDLNEFTDVDTGIDQKLVETIETALKGLDGRLNTSPIMFEKDTLDIVFAIFHKNEEGEIRRKYQIKIEKIKK